MTGNAACCSNSFGPEVVLGVVGMAPQLTLANVRCCRCWSGLRLALCFPAAGRDGRALHVLAVRTLRRWCSMLRKLVPEFQGQLLASDKLRNPVHRCRPRQWRSMLLMWSCLQRSTLRPWTCASPPCEAQRTERLAGACACRDVAMPVPCFPCGTHKSPACAM